jgi:PBP1b-binding outer membrane lipoprotein LpoB
MKKNIWFIVLSALILSGCASWGGKDKNQKNIDNKKSNIQDAKDALTENSKEKMIQVQSLTYGVGYALKKAPTNNIPVKIASELNERIGSLAGTPNMEEINKMKLMVDQLTSKILEEQKKGRELLKVKDQEIIDIQKERDLLKEELSAKQDELAAAATKMAKNADDTKEKLDAMNGFFGLGAVFYGIKRFITSCLIFILVFSIIFLILRILASTNPIAAAFFSIFNMIGGMILQTIRSLAPGSLKSANLVTHDEHNYYKDTLYKIIDTVQEVKQNGKVLNKDLLIKDLFDKLDRNLSDSDKELIAEVKKELKW